MHASVDQLFHPMTFSYSLHVPSTHAFQKKNKKKPGLSQGTRPTLSLAYSQAIFYVASFAGPLNFLLKGYVSLGTIKAIRLAIYCTLDYMFVWVQKHT